MPELNIYIDFKSPAAYLALQPTLELLERQPTPTRWLPLRTRVRPLQPEKPDETKTETHFRVREQARRAMHLHYAAIQGIGMTFPDVPGETDTALAALLFVQKDPLPFIQRAFAAYWQERQDLNDMRVVSRLLDDSGADTVAFDRPQYLQQLEDACAQATEARVVDAPAYVIADQVFIGREHLPWITELIQG